MESLNIKRVGDPVLVRGQDDSSLIQQNQYEIRTTPLPEWPARRHNWIMLFGKHHQGGRFLLEHDGTNKITAECSPDDAAQLIELVDATIAKANDEEVKVETKGTPGS